MCVSGRGAFIHVLLEQLTRLAFHAQNILHGAFAAWQGHAHNDDLDFPKSRVAVIPSHPDGARN